MLIWNIIIIFNKVCIYIYIRSAHLNSVCCVVGYVINNHDMCSFTVAFCIHHIIYDMMCICVVINMKQVRKRERANLTLI
jgi:hypothetical protein